MYQSTEAKVTVKISSTIPGPLSIAHVLRVTIDRQCDPARATSWFKKKRQREPDREVDNRANR